MKNKLKTLMHSKLVKVIITGVAIGTVGIGSTYAWWTAESEAAYTVKTGKMNVKADFTNIENETGYEPGLYVKGDGTIMNTGSVDALVKVSDNSKIKFAYDTDENAIPSDARVFEEVDPSAIVMDILPTIDDSQEDAFWYTGSNGDLYVLMIPGSQVSTHVTQNFLGDKLDNRYMSAVVNTKLKANATQAIEEASLANFDESMENLTPYDGNPMDKTFSTNDYATRAMEFLNDMTNKK